MQKGILVGHDLIDRILQSFQGTVEAIRHSKLLKMQPEALNRVEKRTIFGQPNHQETVFVQAQSGSRGFAVVVRGIIHDENEFLAGILGQKAFQKGHKGITVFVRRREVAYLPAMPVIRAKYMPILGTAGSRN